MTHVSFDDLYRDRRPADRQPQPESAPVEEAPEVKVRPEPMGPEGII